MKDKRFEVRVTKKENQQLTTLATQFGISKAALLRNLLGALVQEIGLENKDQPAEENKSMKKPVAA